MGGSHKGLVIPRAGLDDMEKYTFLNLQGLELRPLDPSALSQNESRVVF
jgi:hypothetical protein